MSGVRIKYQKNGILLKLDDGVPFPELLSEIRKTFEQSRGFFKESRLSLSFSGRTLSGEEEDAIADVIEECTDIRILCVFSQDEKTEDLFVRALEKNNSAHTVVQTPPARKNVGEYMTFCGNMKGREIYRTKENILVLGNIEKDAGLISSQNIAVIGSVYGTVRAGEGGEGRHFVISSDLVPKSLEADGAPCLRLPKKKAFGRKSPGIAMREGEETVIRELSGESLALLYECSGLNFH